MKPAHYRRGAGRLRSPARSAEAYDQGVRAACKSRPARRLITAAVPCQRGSWPIANRPQLIKLPHKASAHPRARSVFHEISRAEGPFKQTTKGDGLSHPEIRASIG